MGLCLEGMGLRLEGMGLCLEGIGLCLEGMGLCLDGTGLRLDVGGLSCRACTAATASMAVSTCGETSSGSLDLRLLPGL